MYIHTPPPSCNIAFTSHISQATPPGRLQDRLREFQDGGGKENTKRTRRNANSSAKTHYSDSQSGHKSLTGRNKSYSSQFSFIIRYNVSDRKALQLLPLPLSISHASGAYGTVKKLQHSAANRRKET
jgi:hypothetical protein